MKESLKVRTEKGQREELMKGVSKGILEEVGRAKASLLTEDLVEIMKENFERLDRHEDLVVPRALLVDSIRKDVRIKKYLNKGVVHLPQVNKVIALRKILHQIEQEEHLKSDKLDTGDSNFISSKKYISWKNFMDYFLNYSKNENVQDIDLEFKRDTTDDQNMIEIPKVLKERMRAIFNECKNGEGYVKSIEYLDKLKLDPTVFSMMEAKSRIQAKYGDLPAENLRETLARVEDNIEDFTEWDEFIQYFTRRGSPVPIEKDEMRLTNIVAPVDFQKDPSSLVERAQMGLGGSITKVGAALNQGSYPSMTRREQTPGDSYGSINHLLEPPKGKMDTSVENGGYAFGEDKTQMFIPHVRLTSDSLAETQMMAPGPKTPFNTVEGHDIVDYAREKERHLTSLEGPRDRQGEVQNETAGFVPILPTSDRLLEEDRDDEAVVDDYVYFGDDERRFKITVPSGLKFEAREERRAKSTKNRKFEEYLEKKRVEEEEALRFRFRANSVPKKVKQPLYEKIMHVGLFYFRNKS